jgi:uncharacterized protein YbjT (DUF2867 family)
VPIVDGGRLYAPIGDARVSAVDVRDIAAVAALALTQPGHAGRTYTITGPAAITHGDIARAVGEASGAMSCSGSPPRDVLRFARDYADAFRGSASPKTQ